MTPAPSHLERVAAAILFAAAAVVYLPDVGHGFVKDDFVWIARSSLSWTGLRAAFGAPTGFFRPTVSMLFGANRFACGLHARCYGVVNFALLVGCAGGVLFLTRSFLRSAGAAVAAAAIWLFNWHGINMAALWISGRTALALVLFGTIGAGLFVRRRWLFAAPFVFAAMLSKEEGVLLPAILAVWLMIDLGDIGGTAEHRPDRRIRDLVPPLGALALLEVGYFLLRARSGAFTAASAPDYYELSFAPARLAANLLQYVDRSATFAAVVLLVCWAIARPPRSALDRRAVRAVLAGAIWWVGGFGLTMFLPTRSSLYAVFPSIGAALAAATIGERWWATVSLARQTRAIVAGLCAPFLLSPIYASRNRPAVREAELSAAVIAAVQRTAAELGAGTRIELRDDRSGRPTLDGAFGTLVQDAVDLTVTPRVTIWIDPPPTDAARAGLRPGNRADAVLALREGRIVRLPQPFPNATRPGS